MVPEDGENDQEKSFEQLIQEKNVLAKKQAMKNAIIVKKMDPKKQSKEVGEGIIKAIRVFDEVIINEPRRVEDAEFMDQYEEMWAIFLRLGNELSLQNR